MDKRFFLTAANLLALDLLALLFNDQLFNGSARLVRFAVRGRQQGEREGA